MKKIEKFVYITSITITVIISAIIYYIDIYLNIKEINKNKKII